MEYREIVSVTGLSGLYQLMATKSDGAIVRNLADNTTRFISARLHNVTPLESIEIYTVSDNVRLHEVLDKMKASEPARPDPKSSSNQDIKTYFKTVFPDLDEDRVYASDMKKMLRWYDLLQANELLDFSNMHQKAENADTDLSGEESAQISEHEKDPTEVTLLEDGGKPAKKSAVKKEEEGEEKPAKKVKAKKAAEDEAGAEKPAKKTAKKKKEED